MPPVHKQHKESILCQTKGMYICPPYIWMPYMLGCTHCMFEFPLMFRWPPVCLDTPYVWTPPVCLDAPICLDTPHMFGCPPVYLDNTICLHSLICLDAPCMFGCPLCLDTHLYGWMSPHVWTPPVCLDALHMFGCPLYVWMSPKCMGASEGMRGIQTYG